MSTLGTFAQFAKLQAAPKRPDRNVGQALVDRAKSDSELLNPKVSKAIANQSKTIGKKESEAAGQAYKTLKKTKLRNLGIAGGLGLAGLGTAGAIAYNNRNSKRRSEMSAKSAYANFATKSYGEVTPEMKAGTGKALTQDELDRLKKVKDARKEGAQTADQIKATQDKLKAYKGQRAIERNVDSGGDVYKGAKGAGDYLSRTSALLTSPERKVIAAGKNSKNGFVKGLATNAEKFGRAGYKTGATGLRGVGNAVVGRTLTGKVARLGAAGIGLSAIGGAMKRKRQEGE